MTMTAKIDCSQLDEAVSGIVSRSTEAQAEAALAGAKFLVPILQQAAPRRTGKAAKTITAERTGYEQGYATAGVGPTGARWYLRFHETGTSKMSARPFVEPNVLAKSEEMHKEIGKAYLKQLGVE